MTNLQPLTTLINPDEGLMPSDTYLSSLNEVQRQAVEHTEGPLLVLAGAGTGKTRVLTTRLVHILRQGRASPAEIFAVTFTNKAANEMRLRIEALIGMPYQGGWLGTFHSLAVRILRRHAELIDLQPSFTILDGDDQIRLIKQLLAAENIDDKKNPPRLIAAIISRWKDRALTPEKVFTQDATGSKVALKIYELYQSRLKTLNAVDFGDLLMFCLDLFVNFSEVSKLYLNQFKYIMVDEYQDTNVCQYLWLRALAQGMGNICCVGDDDQSIYGWRGAEVENILRFEKDFPGSEIIRLEQNYRSSHHILGAASGLIANNKGRLGKTLWTSAETGEKVRIRSVWDGSEEARIVCQEMESLKLKGASLSEMSVLVRASFQTREFEDRLLVLGIPYRVIGGPRFYERQEIRDALAYLRMVYQPNDSLAFERIMNTPKRGIGAATLQTLHAYARLEQISLMESARRLVSTDEIRGKARAALMHLITEIERWRGMMSTMKPGDLARQVMDESGYTGMWQASKQPDAPGRLENLKELVSAMDEFETLEGFLEHVSLIMENAATNGQAEAVQIMTLHSAKGLEFDHVFLAGWEEGLFPHPRSLKEEASNGLEEERRLAYVGITRARAQVTILSAANRRVYGRWQSSPPSRFIRELPKEHTETHVHTFAQPAAHRREPAGDGMTQGMFDRSPPPMPITRTTSHGFTPGMQVFHQKFGNGVVVRIDGDKLEVAFKTGKKNLMAGFVRAVTPT